MSIAASLIPELEAEASTTRRVLERVPNDKLTWQPHEKSMTLGQLARHIAVGPSDITDYAKIDQMSMEGFKQDPELTSAAELLTIHDAAVAKAKEYLASLDDETAMKEWSIVAGGQTLMAFPRIAMIRTIMFNHWIHHRGQLSVYLRLLDVPVPSIYGPSADENPFG